MIVCQLMGGLGNQMFQYAFCLTLSENYSKPLYVDLSYLAEETIDENKEASFDDLKKALRSKMKDEIEKKESEKKESEKKENEKKKRETKENNRLIFERRWKGLCYF